MSDDGRRVKTRRERFEVVAVRRTNKVIDELWKLNKCFDKLSYKYTEREAMTMLNMIEENLNKIKAGILPKKSIFSLKEEPPCTE